ncbi:MAG: hypothetical protein JSW23_03580 [Planctomycetota bacterium]|nr:MAG: hypothetical protein JSW23_03580 [Planctomycetota bacterium]
MMKYTETALIKSCNANSYPLTKTTPKPPISKTEWIQHYANRILTLWLTWQTPLGVDLDFAEQLKLNLEEFYSEPLKKMFIEATY